MSLGQRLEAWLEYDSNEAELLTIRAISRMYNQSYEDRLVVESDPFNAISWVKDSKTLLGSFHLCWMRLWVIAYLMGQIGRQIVWLRRGAVDNILFHWGPSFLVVVFCVSFLFLFLNYVISCSLPMLFVPFFSPLFTFLFFFIIFKHHRRDAIHRHQLLMATLNTRSSITRDL